MTWTVPDAPRIVSGHIATRALDAEDAALLHEALGLTTYAGVDTRRTHGSRPVQSVRPGALEVTQ